MLIYALTGSFWTILFIRAIPTILFWNTETNQRRQESGQSERGRTHRHAYTKSVPPPLSPPEKVNAKKKINQIWNEESRHVKDRQWEKVTKRVMSKSIKGNQKQWTASRSHFTPCLGEFSHGFWGGVGSCETLLRDITALLPQFSASFNRVLIRL